MSILDKNGNPVTQEEIDAQKSLEDQQKKFKDFTERAAKNFFHMANAEKQTVGAIIPCLFIVLGSFVESQSQSLTTGEFVKNQYCDALKEATRAAKARWPEMFLDKKDIN